MIPVNLFKWLLSGVKSWQECVSRVLFIILSFMIHFKAYVCQDGSNNVSESLQLHHSSGVNDSYLSKYSTKDLLS